MKNLRFVVSATLAVFAASAALLNPTAVFAQDKMAPKMDKMAPKMDKMAPKMSGVYVCKECKMGFTATQAKKMGMKDPMGHKMMKMAMLPKGYKMAPADGKMMMDHKMMDKKMDKMGGGKMAPKMDDKKPM